MTARFWVCVIGPISDELLPPGSDSPPRRAAIEAISDLADLTSRDFECWSGWEDDPDALLAYRDYIAAALESRDQAAT